MSDFSILEGVMGYYDGIAGISLQASAYDVARVTKTPVVLVISTKGMSGSVSALIQGFLRKLPETNDVDRYHSGAVCPCGTGFAKRFDR